MNKTISQEQKRIIIEIDNLRIQNALLEKSAKIYMNHGYSSNPEAVEHFQNTIRMNQLEETLMSDDFYYHNDFKNQREQIIENRIPRKSFDENDVLTSDQKQRLEELEDQKNKNLEVIRTDRENWGHKGFFNPAKDTTERHIEIEREQKSIIESAGLIWSKSKYFSHTYIH